MRKSIWAPSIVPHGDDQTVYLVVDSARTAASGVKPTSNTPISKQSFKTCPPGSARIPLASSLSTLQKGGRRMFLPMSPRSFANAAIYNFGTFHFSCRISPIVTKAGFTISNCLCRCA
jgi:hypothetical protein